MKQTVDIKGKYAACVAATQTANSTINAARRFAVTLGAFGTVSDPYVVPPSAGDPFDNGITYSLAEMLRDGVPPNQPLELIIDFTPASGSLLTSVKKEIMVGLAIEALRSWPLQADEGWAQITGLTKNDVASLFAQQRFPTVLQAMASDAQQIVAVEDGAPA